MSSLGARQACGVWSIAANFNDLHAADRYRGMAGYGQSKLAGHKLPVVYHPPMTTRKALGDFGERVAKAHLEAKGYRILATNFRVREGEVDIVAEHEGVVAFVEVKTRRGDAMGSAVESVDARKARRLLLAAEAFAQQQPSLPPDRRIDLIAIDLDANGHVVSLQHVESAVEEA